MENLLLATLSLTVGAYAILTALHNHQVALLVVR